MSAWLLPDHLADVLPSEARHIEELRRSLLDTARSYGYELVMPPMLEHLESLLTGTGAALDLQTFKLVDQLSGRSLGLRADTTPQAARIDAHLLNRQGVVRLSYCGPVLHTRVQSPRASREPLQLGCELFGHAGPEADLEVLALAIDCLRAAKVGGLRVELSDASVVRAQFAGVVADAGVLQQVQDALARKDRARLTVLTAAMPAAVQAAAAALTHLYGDAATVLPRAQACLREPQRLAALAQLAQSLPADVQVGMDLADARGYGYYSGVRFAIYATEPRSSGMDALARGGRYDEVGAVFGRNRAAVGFSLDLKTLAAQALAPAPKAAIRAPWAADAALQAAVQRLRAAGEVVVSALPGHEHELQEFTCDRELVSMGGRWAVKAIA